MEVDADVDVTALRRFVAAQHDLGVAIRPAFALDFRRIHLNHGSYGTAPRSIMSVGRDWMDVIESFPDDWMRRRALGEFTSVCARLASFLHAPPGSVAFVENATVAVNTVLRCARVAAGEVLLMNDNTYNACKNAVEDTARARGAHVVTFKFSMPPDSNAGMVRELESALQAAAARGRVAFVLLDHITSPTAVVMPVRDMVASCRRLAPGVQVMIDGAHAPGQLDLDLPHIGADWYTGNLHKWCFTLKGCAFLHARDDVIDGTQSLVISHYWRLPFLHRFWMQGTNDQSRFMAVPAALDFMQHALGGVRRMRAYNACLARAAAVMLCEAWGTTPLAPRHLCAPFLVAIEAPLSYRDFTRGKAGARVPGIEGMCEEDACAAAGEDAGLNERVAQAIFERDGIQSQFFFWQVRGQAGGAPLRGAIFCRISAQVYNCMADYEALAAAVLRLKQAVKAAA